MTPRTVSFSVIVPTIGRRSLIRTLASIVEQLEPGDELLVAWNRDGDFGNGARQSLLDRARGTHVVFMDDDDQYARGAFATMRRFALDHPDRIGIFRHRYRDGRLLWAEPVVRRANVSTVMYCVPNVSGKLGMWTDGTTVSNDPERRDYADLDFIVQTIALQGEPVFRDEVTVLIRSDRRPWVRVLQRAARPFQAALRRMGIRR